MGLFCLQFYMCKLQKPLIILQAFANFLTLFHLFITPSNWYYVMFFHTF